MTYYIFVVVFRFIFECHIESDEIPEVKWFKDNLPLTSPDYETRFENGVATLTIEETFSEDTARYTCRVTNQAGMAESSAHLNVKGKHFIFNLLKLFSYYSVLSLRPLNKVLFLCLGQCCCCTFRYFKPVPKRSHPIVWHKAIHRYSPTFGTQIHCLLSLPFILQLYLLLLLGAG